MFFSRGKYGVEAVGKQLDFMSSTLGFEINWCSVYAQVLMCIGSLELDDLLFASLYTIIYIEYNIHTHFWFVGFGEVDIYG